MLEHNCYRALLIQVQKGVFDTARIRQRMRMWGKVMEMSRKHHLLEYDLDYDFYNQVNLPEHYKQSSSFMNL